MGSLTVANSDPNRTVTWGEQIWDEMVFGVIRYRSVREDGSPDKPKGAGRNQEPGASN
ncbi:MAG TPA: hypothetical protein VIZ63_11885 [Povalibacter sp.]